MPTDRRSQSAAEDMAVTDYPTARWFAIAPTDGSKSATRVGQKTPPSSLRRKVKVKGRNAIFSHVLLNIAFQFLLCMRKVFARIRSCGVLDAAELRFLVISLLRTVAQLEAKVAAMTEEIARLKELKGRPKPSGMVKGNDTPPAPSGGTGRPKRWSPQPPKGAQLIIDEERIP